MTAAAFLSIGACVTPDPAEGDSTLWQCDSGVSFSTGMTVGGNAEVTAGGKVYHLPARMAASGARYFDGNVEFWEHGGEAMLNGAAGGPYNNCRT